MRITILLIGKTGQIGSELERFLPSFGDVIAPTRNELDLLKPHDIRRAVRSIRPNLIINAAAYTAIDAAEADEPTARALNAEAPALLAKEARNVCAAILHYSADYIFDGSKRAPYKEPDPRNPIHVCGRTKLAGEEAIRVSGVPYLIFRTRCVYSDQGRNFLLSILRLAAQKQELQVVREQIGAPTCGWDIAWATLRILSGLYTPDAAMPGIAKVSGTFHMTAAGETTWFDFARANLERAAVIPYDISWIAAATSSRPLIAKRVVPVAAGDHPTPAARLAYSILSNAKFFQVFGFQLPNWRTQLQGLFARRSYFAPQLQARKFGT